MHHHPYYLARPRVGPSSRSLSSPPRQSEGDGAPRGATIVLDVPAFPRGNTGRHSARHPDKLAQSGLTCGVFLPAPGRALRRVCVQRSRVSASSWQEALVPPGGAPAPPECELAKLARRRRIPLRPYDASRERPSASGIKEINPIFRSKSI